MSDYYSYTFGGALPLSFANNVANPPLFMDVSGSFMVDYDQQYGIYNITNSNIAIDGLAPTRSYFSNTINKDGSITYDAHFNFTPITDLNTRFLDIKYTGKLPSAFISTEYFYTTSDYSGGTQRNESADYKIQQLSVTSAIVCYMTGTRIRTTRGEVAVEALLVGDLAVTASGEHRPIRWIGQRTMDPRRHRVPAEAQPVRIRAHALGDNRPARDLVVSPGHSIALDVLGEVLIPAGSLVNGATIVQEDVDSVTYWHVELDSHDLLVAENLASESYLDMGNRGFFAGSSDRAAVVALGAGPDADPAERSHADFCRPYHADGLLVDAVRAQIRRRIEALGWRVEAVAPFADAYLEVDGRRVQPAVAGLSASFALPADARNVWLVCPTSAPRAVGLGSDPRALGLCLSSIALEASHGATRMVALDDPLLCLGFHAAEPDHRWTAGRARLPAALFAGRDGETVLRLDLAMPSLPRWVEVGRSDDLALKAA